jgi:hypothetical protein
MLAAVCTLASLLPAAEPLPPDVVPLNQRSFQIPIRIDESRRHDIKELVLYVSTDQGQHWAYQARATPDTKDFVFNAQTEGVYYFTVAIINQQDKQEPDNLYTAPVSLKVLVDTLKPDLRLLSAERQGDEIVVAWEARDEHLDPGTLKLEYRMTEPAGSPWTPAAVPPTASGQARFHPAGLGALQVRMQVEDLLKNVAVTLPLDVAGAPGAPAAPLPPPPAPAPTPTPVTGSTDAKEWAAPGGSSIRPVSRSERVDAPPPFSSTAPGSAPLVSAATGQQIVAKAGGAAPAPEVAPVAQPALGPQSPVSTLPMLQFTHDRQVTLEYEVTKFGPSGVGSVEVYVTRDDGQSWQLSGTPQSVSLAGPADAKAQPAASLRRSVTVTLTEEGVVYGFYLVVKSGAGLGKPAPRNGTPPQIRIELDTTLPYVELYELVPDPASRDSLIVSWKATDRNLESKVRLEWAAEQRDGHWEPVGGGELENTGRTSWQLPPGMPAQVYLRLTARDKAGNVSVALTQKPILIDLNQPEVANVSLHVGTAP